MKIKKSKWKPVDEKFNGGILSGHLTYNGTLQLLVDKIPEVEYERIGNYFYGEKDGYCSVYEYQKGSTDGFAGRTITLKIKGGGNVDFKGSLWDPMLKPENIPEYRHISITTDAEVFERGYTFYGGKITTKLWDKLLKKLKVKAVLKDFYSNLTS